MDNAKIATLNKQLKDLQENYGIIAADYVKFKEEFIGKLEGLSDEIQVVKWEIRQEKMPREE
jgi:archaellum component FlaC